MLAPTHRPPRMHRSLTPAARRPTATPPPTRAQGPGKEEKIAAGNAAQVMGRMGTPEEIGEVVLHLAEAKFTTGVEYLCTGGAELGYGTKA